MSRENIQVLGFHQVTASFGSIGTQVVDGAVNALHWVGRQLGVTNKERTEWELHHAGLVIETSAGFWVLSSQQRQASLLRS